MEDTGNSVSVLVGRMLMCQWSVLVCKCFSWGVSVLEFKLYLSVAWESVSVFVCWCVSVLAERVFQQ